MIEKPAWCPVAGSAIVALSAALAVSGMMLVPSGRALAGDLRFSERFHPLALETTPQGLAVGDLNGDGIADLAIAHTGSGASDSLVRVYRGDGHGGFAAAGEYGVGPAPVGIAIGDLDADGMPDLAVACSGAGAVSVLRGAGDLAFEPRRDLESGLRPVISSVADVDADGHDDLLVVNLGNGAIPPQGLQAVAAGAFTDSSSVRIFLSRGTALESDARIGFAFAETLDLVSGAQPVGAAAGDLDGDGRADIAVALRGSNSLAVWLAQPGGGFGAPRELEMEGAPGDVAIADVNRDGRLDVVSVLLPVPGEPQNRYGIVVVPGGSAEAFEPRTTWHTGALAYRLVAADIDADGNGDLVLLTRNGIGVLRGRGDATFADPEILLVDAAAGHAVADLDGDHKLDLVTLHPRGNIGLTLRGNGDGTFGDARTIETGNAPNALERVDLNADGRADLVTADTGDGTISVYMARGESGFESRRQIPVDEAPVRIASGDVDEDGDADLVLLRVRGRASEMALLRNRGDGTFEPKESLASGIDPADVVVADLNGDRKLDLIVPRANQPEILFYLAKGRGRFENAQRVALRHRPDAFTAGDVNRDGKIDLVTAETNSGVVTVLLGSGDGTFTPAPAFKSRYAPSALAIADVDGDGSPDLVVAPRQSLGTGAVLLGGGDGTFGKRLDFAVGQGFGLPVLADLDSDGRLDLVAPDGATGCVSVLPGGESGFGPAIDFGAGPDPSAVAVLDFDGDGRLDLVAASRGANLLILHRNRTTP